MSSSNGEHKRLLRNPLHRDTLYMAQDGKCARCGGALGDDWEADHRVPWKFVQRTNLAEMQALCQQCHKRKGMTVDLQGFDYRRTVLRPGQRRAINVILEHRRGGQQLTSIQLVARYGKSDTIRLSALEMGSLGLISHALIITPFDFLREQMLDETILQASARRYGFHRTMFGQVQPIDGETPIRRPRFKGRLLSSITTPKTARPENLAMLTSMAESALNGPQGPGLPWAVYLDEAHMAGEGRAWGEIVPAFVEAGAYVIVLTGTPFRNDGSPIPGFKRNLVEWEDRNGRPRVGWEHIADVTVTYADALQETPPPVAYITYQPFGIAGDLIDRDTGEIRYTTLDDLEDDQIRAAYLPSLSNPVIIAVPLRFMLAELRNRRAEPGQGGTLGVVFIGSDVEGVSDDEVKQGDTVENWESFTLEYQSYLDTWSEAEEHKVWEKVPYDNPFGTKDEMMRQLKIGDDKQAKRRADVQPIARRIRLLVHGGDRRSKEFQKKFQPDNCQVETSKYGNSKEYLLARLCLLHYDIYERWERGEFRSARAAAIAAGMPVEPTKRTVALGNNVDRLADALHGHYTPEQFTELSRRMLQLRRHDRRGDSNGK